MLLLPRSLLICSFCAVHEPNKVLQRCSFLMYIVCILLSSFCHSFRTKNVCWIPCGSINHSTTSQKTSQGAEACMPNKGSRSRQLVGNESRFRTTHLAVITSHTYPEQAAEPPFQPKSLHTVPISLDKNRNCEGECSSLY